MILPSGMISQRNLRQELSSCCDVVFTFHIFHIAFLWDVFFYPLGFASFLRG